LGIFDSIKDSGGENSEIGKKIIIPNIEDADEAHNAYPILRFDSANFENQQVDNDERVNSC
jgi:hypothetical protein